MKYLQLVRKTCLKLICKIMLALAHTVATKISSTIFTHSSCALQPTCKILLLAFLWSIRTFRDMGTLRHACEKSCIELCVDCMSCVKLHCGIWLCEKACCNLKQTMNKRKWKSIISCSFSIKLNSSLKSWSYGSCLDSQSCHNDWARTNKQITSVGHLFHKDWKWGKMPCLQEGLAVQGRQHRRPQQALERCPQEALSGIWVSCGQESKWES